MSSEQLFANGRIAVISTRLMGADRFNRLAECASVEEALHVLNEASYGAGTEANDCESLLRAELDSVMTDIKELCCNANALNFLLCKYDYHNAKVLMKGKYLRQDLTEYCFRNARYSVTEMRDAFNNDDYGAYTKRMAEACDAIDAEYANGNRSPQVIDKLLDKAYFADLKHFATASMSRLLKKLSDLQINVANLTFLTRAAKISAPQAEEWLIDGGSISKKTLMGLLEGKLSASDLPQEYRAVFQGVDVERVCVKIRSALIEEYADPFTLQLALQYFYAKVDETEKVRRIIADIKNGVDKEKIKEKLNAQ